MRYTAKSPKEAINKMIRNEVVSSYAFVYVRENELAHEMQRYSANYIQGQDQELIKSRCNLIDGIYHLKSEWI